MGEHSQIYPTRAAHLIAVVMLSIAVLGSQTSKPPVDRQMACPWRPV